MPDLITNERARVNLPTAQASDDDTIDTLITAASEAIERFCHRRFPATAHDDLLDGAGDRFLLLRHAPILSVTSVRGRPSTVLTVINSSTANQQARVAVTASGVELVHVASGVTTTSAVAFAGNVTLSALASAITALGSGWSALALGNFGDWPSADLFMQGALPALGRSAGLRLHVQEVDDFRIDTAKGWLIRSSWPAGCQNFRVQYTAGFATVPADVQEACAELVATWFAQRGRDLTLAAEYSVGAYSFQAQDGDRLPDRVRGLLRPYRLLMV